MPKIEKDKTHQPAKTFKKGCLFWILFFSVVAILILMYALFVLRKTQPLTPKEVFFKNTFDGFLHIKPDEKLRQDIFDVIVGYMNAESKSEKIDGKKLSLYVDYMFYPDVYIFLKKGKADEPAAENYLIIFNIKRLPNLIRKVFSQALDKRKYTLEEASRSSFKKYHYTSGDETFYLTIADTCLLFSNDDKMIDNAAADKIRNAPEANNMSDNFKAILGKTTPSSTVYGFFINANGRFEDYLADEIATGDPVSDVIKESFGFVDNHSEIASSIDTIIIDLKPDNGKFSLKILGLCGNDDGAKMLSAALNGAVFPELDKAFSKTVILGAKSEAAGSECVVNIELDSPDSALREILKR